MINTKIICVHVFISGKVQGVGYRYSTVKEAQKLGLTGWVRNLSDGRVEAVFEGDQLKVDKMIKWCYIGTKTANVTEVELEKKEPEFSQEFEVIY
ncbi:acylphosphatase [Aphanothece sacrum]|uniref:acylphosphatase n=1 Tax=Aphanothece sacrum FPU1 TaxID=1920663 RepID=A0A401IGN0_APHSA|nr:acylphosphatase [Aphanothece sacrum]GBF80366.1 acylphosphatase [Aphanothece sacrum FPU1]GBF84927.1 acylphosphatase [Aphanothece sacrum FPU3]